MSAGQRELVDGIERLPDGWNAVRTKEMFREVDERTTTEEPESLLSVSKYHGVVPRDELTDKEARADSLVGYKRCRCGDIVINKMLAWMGALGYARQDGIVSPDYTVIRATADVSPTYYAYLFQTPEYTAEFRRWSNGVTPSRWRLHTEDLGRIVSLLPSKSQQIRIAAFLDRKTAAIDALIAKKERLIELLQEKRQALITQAVTKGLDPKAPRKDSGIEWLGEIPAHWPVVRVSYIAKVQNGMTPSRDRIDYWEDGTVPWISSSQVNDYVVTSAREFITDRAIRETRIRMVPAGSVLVGLVGQGKTRGLSARMEIAGCINQNVAAITSGASMDGRFLHLVLRHAYPSIRELGRGGQQDAMNCDIIRSLQVPMPPFPEQLRLIDHVDGQHAALDAVIGRVESHVELLREYRQALISASVTGKIEIPAEEAA